MSKAPTMAPDDPPVEHVVELLRERLYGAISCLATLAVLARYTTENTSAWVRVLDVLVAAGGLWAASLLAAFVARLSVEGRAPRGAAALSMVRSSGQILQAAMVPIVILIIGAVGWLDTPTAVWLAMWFLVIEMALIVFLAVRRTALPWWQQALAVLVLTGMGAAVVAIKMIAH
ncbi:hypothetical protein M1247_12860 [Mycobacterium sp. 21AC1]|uniref:hypothetical protein n=1 Tax=[Mycobacterium] appelbergii TaxID=2939269 RepID=UPI0029393E60|nr:hypothetical protein [Mycobacterium sp. 21AC1]MDV3125811.1 hypothetical protein [Mycobacterium sp. 21AC1]